MKTTKRETERGIALITVMIFLIILSAMAAGLMYMVSIETQINYNFRGEQTAYFAAKAGIEELRDRMMATNANSIAANLPTVAATSADSTSVLYLLNEGNKSGTVLPWTAGNQYMDTELCHDGYTGLGLTAPASNIPCTSVPSTGSYTKAYSVLPFSGTSAAIPFKWVRVTLKQGSSVQNYPVNGNSSSLVCWNGTYEQLLPAGTSSCAAMSPSANPVYLLTALAVTSTGARKMVQAEVALQPSQPFLWGLFATGNGCGAVSLSGNVSTDSYTSANGGTYASTNTTTGGDVGSNGSVSANGSVSIGGSVGSSKYGPTIGSCPGNAFSGSAGQIVSNPNNKIMQIAAPTIPTPVIPGTTGPNKSDPGTLSPGSYGDLTIKHGATTLAAGVYNINSITISANGSLVVTGPVTLNVQGTSQSTPIDLQGQGIANNTGIASNLQINYAGTGTVKIAGGSGAYAVVLAPNASVSMVGNSNIYGAIVGNTISNSGTPKFHYDKNVKSPVQTTSYYSLISYRELFY